MSQQTNSAKAEGSKESPDETPVSDLMISRRAVLGLVGVGITGGAVLYAGAKSDVDGDGLSTQTELEEGLNPLSRFSAGGAMPDGKRSAYGLPDDRTYSEREVAALERTEYLRDTNDDIVYSSHRMNFGEHSSFSSAIDPWNAFVHDDRVHDDFIDIQLGYWLALPDLLDDEQRAEDWQRGVLTYDPADMPVEKDTAPTGYHLTDWTKTGEPQLAPAPNGDGWVEGPGYRSPEPVNPDGDAFMPAWYNHTGLVHDPVTGRYLGFQPEKGDRVGKRGDANGDGSIAAYLDGDVAADDLIGNRISVWMIDYMEGERPPAETFNLMDNFYVDAPIGDGVEFYHFWNDDPMSSQYITTVREAIDRYENQVPEELQGPLNYALYTGRIEDGAQGRAMPVDQGNAGYMHTYDFADIPLRNASVALEEVLWHGVGSGDTDYHGHNNTLTASDEAGLQLHPGQWAEIRQRFPIGQRRFFHGLPLG